jgi:hypothetical protein
MDVGDAIREADAILPGVESEELVDPRWQAIIRVGEYVETDPEPVWQFIRRWGAYPDEDLRAAVATVLLEHLLEYHFAAYFPLVEREAVGNPLFGDTFLSCWRFGQAKEPGNADRFVSLVAQLHFVE